MLLERLCVIRSFATLSRVSQARPRLTRILRFGLVVLTHIPRLRLGTSLNRICSTKFENASNLRLVKSLYISSSIRLVMKNKYLKLPLFLVVAWIFAFIYEEIPRIILRNLTGVQHLWELGSGWFLFFLIWYGTIFLIFYFIFINKNIKYPVIFGILYGIIFETFYFKKMENIFSFILFVLLYFGMFYFPFKISVGVIPTACCGSD